MNPGTEALDAMLDELMPTATELVVSVRDLDAAAVARLLEPLDVLQLRALLVAVSVMVPDDVPFADLLAWTHAEPAAGGKWCFGCERMRPFSAFHIDRSKEDGRKSRCRSCVQRAKVARLAQGEAA